MSLYELTVDQAGWISSALDDKSDSDTVSRIPLLSDLPIIGPLFRSKQNIRNDGETLFFFTPTLLPDLQPGGIFMVRCLQSQIPSSEERFD